MIEVFYVVAFTMACMFALLFFAQWQDRNDAKKKPSNYKVDSSASQGEQIAEK